MRDGLKMTELNLNWSHWINKLWFVVTVPVWYKLWKNTSPFLMIGLNKSVTTEAWILYDFNKIKDLKIHWLLSKSACIFSETSTVFLIFITANTSSILPIRPGYGWIILLLLWPSALLFQRVTVKHRFLWIIFSYSKYSATFKERLFDL